MIVTKWFRSDGTGKLEFNHISNGYHPRHESPAYVSEEQRKAWQGVVWVAQKAELKDGAVTAGAGSVE